MKHLFFTAVDVWLFRDGRPFSAGSDHRAESLFPPTPLTMQGAVRTHELVRQGVAVDDPAAVEKAVGKPMAQVASRADLKNLCLQGPYLARREDGKVYRYFPLPADAWVEKRHNQLEARPASPPTQLPGSVRSGRLQTPESKRLTKSLGETLLDPPVFLAGVGDMLKPPPDGGQGGKGGQRSWIRQDHLVAYFNRQRYAKLISAGELYETENRFGIGIDNQTHTVRTGILYEVGFIRPQTDVGLLVDMDGYAGWNEGRLLLGGESRAADYEALEESQVEPLPQQMQTLPARFRAYFSAPAYFANGWQPADWSKLFGGPVELVAAALSGYQSLGGFDLQADPNLANAHRPARRYVPAGSVYYFQTQTTGLKPPAALTDFGAEIGFGQVLFFKEW